MIVSSYVARGSDFKAISIAVIVLAVPWAGACEPIAVSCTESATCAPIPRDAGIDASTEAGEMDAGSPEPDVSVDTAEPPHIDVTVEISVDSPKREDAETGSLQDAATTPDVVDAAGETDVCDATTGRSPVDTPCLISDRYGVFVSPQGSDFSGAGTRDAPYQTIARALKKAQGNVMRVYVCDEGSGYLDPLTVDSTVDGMSLYGGFDCSTWTYATTRRARVHPTAGLALAVKGLAVGLTVEDFEFDAADASPGASSIGAIVDTAMNVVLRRVKVAAGKGGAGANGADGAPGDEAPRVMGQQIGSPALCPASMQQQNGGSWSGPSNCFSRGGSGGPAARDLEGTDGIAGAPMTGVTTSGLGKGGPHGLTGQDGQSGSDGNAGDSGAANLASGTFSAAGYDLAAAAGSGTAGNTGQGGGGGGASNAGFGSGCFGATGGAGGMGGCGGTPGMGGASAGASVALLSWMSEVTFDRCDILGADGGAGGTGGTGGLGSKGQPGALGGAAYPDDAGMSLGAGGSGGPGGNGGNGGSGAGGNGGPSYALVYRGTVPTKLNGTVLAHGAGGAKGIGGGIDIIKAPSGFVGSAADELMVP